MPYTFNWRFRAFDPITKRWYTARYAADIDTIHSTHAQLAPGQQSRYSDAIPQSSQLIA